MVKIIISSLVSVVVIGLALALLRSFDWDIAELLNWVWGFVIGLVESVADFFTGNKTFQKVVSS